MTEAIKSFRVSRRNPCPICTSHGHKGIDGCLVFPVFDADKRETGKKVICIRVQSGDPAPGNPMGWYHYTNPDTQPVYRKKADIIKPKEDKLASPEKRDRLYRKILKKFGLSDAHRQFLEARKIKKLELFATLKRPPGGVNWIRWHGENPSGVPGFYKRGDDWFLWAGTEGILYPIISGGLIHGFQIRADHAFKDGRYRFWSTSHKENGGTGTTPHVHEEWPAEAETVKRAWITEGLAKAQQIAGYYGELALSVQGVSSFAPALQRARELGIRELVIAYDMDMDEKIQVKAAFQALLKAAEEFTVYQATWPSAFKGIDDALLADITPQIHLIHTCDYLPLDEAQNELRELATRLLSSKEPSFNLIQTTVGSSKTTSYIETLNRMHNHGEWPLVEIEDQLPGLNTRYARIAFLVDTKQQVLEIMQKLSFKPDVLLGRSEDENSLFYCTQKEQCDAAGAAGHNVFKSVCLTCPFLADCQTYWYQAQVQKIMENSRFILATKSAFFNKSNRMEKMDIIIADESIHQYLFPIETVTAEDIATLRRTLLFKKCDDDDIFAQLEMLDYNLKNAGPLITAVEMGWITSTLHKNWLLPWVDAEGKTVYPKDIFGEIHRSVCSIQRGKLLLCRPLTKLISEMRKKLVINLDATPMASLLNIFDVKNHTFQVRQHLHVTQIQDVKGSQKELEQEIYQNRFFTAIKALSGDNEKTAVFGPKSFISMISRSLPETDMGWYGNQTRATNQYADHDHVILIGDFIINIGILDLYRRAALAFCNTPTTIERLAQESREAEFQQAIGRGRATLRCEENPLRVTILSNVPLQKIKVHRQVRKLEQLYRDEPAKDTFTKRASRESIELAKVDLQAQAAAAGKTIGKDSSSANMEAYYLASAKTIQMQTDQWIPEFFPVSDDSFSNIFNRLADSDWEKICTPAVRAAFTGWRPNVGTERTWKKFYSVLGREDLPNMTEAARSAKLDPKTFRGYVAVVIEEQQSRANWRQLLLDYFSDRTSPTWLADGFERLWETGLLKGPAAAELTEIFTQWLELQLITEDPDRAQVVADHFLNTLRRYPTKIHLSRLESRYARK